jgi:hypothetical protein
MCANVSDMITASMFRAEWISEDGKCGFVKNIDSSVPTRLHGANARIRSF